MTPVAKRIDLLPFAGYAESGGRGDAPNIHGRFGRLGSGTVSTRFRSIEAGALVLFSLGSLRVGAGAAVDWLVDARRVVRVEAAEPGVEQTVFRTDESRHFRKWSASAGVRGEQSIARVIVLSAEAWYSLGYVDLWSNREVRPIQMRAAVGIRI